MKTNTLYPHEWFAIIAYSTIFLFLCFLSWLNDGSAFVEEFKKEGDNIVATISGAVSNPGLYKLQKGESVNSLLQKAGLEANADLSKIDRDAELQEGMRIKIPVTKMMNIYIQRVDNIKEKITVPCKTSFDALKKLVPIAKGEQFRINKRRKFVRKNENIIIDQDPGT